MAVTLEGVRPILIEVQALVSSAVYGTPQRTATGFDTRRLNMLLAVLEKRAGFRLAAKDGSGFFDCTDEEISKILMPFFRDIQL